MAAPVTFHLVGPNDWLSGARHERLPSRSVCLRQQKVLALRTSQLMPLIAAVLVGQ
jgi:hypothetical protein